MNRQIFIPSNRCMRCLLRIWVRQKKNNSNNHHQIEINDKQFVSQWKTGLWHVIASKNWLKKIVYWINISVDALRSIGHVQFYHNSRPICDGRRKSWPSTGFECTTITLKRRKKKLEKKLWKGSQREWNEKENGMIWKLSVNECCALRHLFMWKAFSIRMLIDKYRFHFGFMNELLLTGNNRHSLCWWFLR